MPKYRMNLYYRRKQKKFTESIIISIDLLLAMNHGNPIGLQNSLPIMVSISSKNLLTPEINYMDVNFR
jgi:hypothetical protein